MSSKISALGALAAADLASGDLLVAVDVSDTSMAPTGTDKKVTLASIVDAVSTIGALATDAEVAAAIAALSTTYQPLDSDLSAIATLSTTSYGRGLLTLSSVAGLGTGTASSSTFLRGDGTWAAAGGSGGGDLLAANNLSDIANAATARTNLGLAIGTNVQAYDSDLAAIAALSTTSYGRAFLALADAAAGRTALGLGSIATQASSSVTITGGSITGITDLAVADGGTGSSTAAGARSNLGFDETGIVDGNVPVWLAAGSKYIPATVISPSAYIQTLLDDADAATARSTLGLGTIATQASSAVSISGGSVTGITDLAVADGGTGASTAASARGNLGIYETGIADGNVPAWSATNSRYEPATLLAASAVFAQAQSFNAQTGTTYTLVAGDAGKVVSLSNASSITLTVPQDSDATIAVGTWVELYQLGAGQVTVAAGSGATLRVSGLTAKARAQYSRLAVQKVSANTWSLMGDLAAS